MGKHIIYETPSNNYVDKNNKSIRALSNLKRINLLVGENNSGKSRFMRSLIENNVENKCRLITEKEIKQIDIYKFENSIKEILYQIKYAYNDDYFIIKNECEKLNLADKFMYLYNLYFTHLLPKKANERILSELSEMLNYRIDKRIIRSENYYYIPVLRGIENFEVYFEGKEKLNNIQMTLDDMERLNSYTGQSKSIYENKVRKIYKINGEKIFTGENLYEEVVDILLGEEKRRKIFHDFEKFISENFYNGEGFSINPNQTNKCLMVKIKNDPERRIYNLGDGIKQLIVLLYQIYMHKDEEYIFFIEEPEINLHPGFQRKLMELLLSDTFSLHTYFINTHSNHIIDIINDSKDIKIYQFKKKQNITEIIEVEEDYVSILNELGIRSSSIFLSNCNIWIEGISDRIYLKKYLEVYFKYLKKENFYKENIHYSFVEYGGGNLPHWNFNSKEIASDQINVNYLSHNTFLIVDNDNTSKNIMSKKHQRKIMLKYILKENFYEHHSKEIENLISLQTLENMLKKDNKLDTINRLKYITPRYPYEQSVLSNPNMGIGKFIDETYELKKKYRAYSSDTIKNKAEFASKICDEIKSWDDLTEEAKNMTKKVAIFIMENNE